MERLIKLICCCALCFLSYSCSVVREIPVQTIEKVIYKDSLIYIRDSIEIPVPYEVVREILPKDTTSILRTSVAMSEAKIDKGMLHHKLEQNGTVKTRIDTFYVTKTVEKIKEVEVPVEVIKEVKHIPNWCWYSLIFNIFVVLVVVFRIYLKFVKKV